MKSTLSALRINPKRQGTPHSTKALKAKATRSKKSPHERNVRRERSRKKGPRATVVTKHHAVGKHPLAGSEERGIVFRFRSLELKMRGLTLREIGLELQREFELVKAPPVGTVYDWIQTALREGVKGNSAVAREFIEILILRVEEVVRRLMPVILDDFQLERQKTINGKTVRVIEENAFSARLKAAQEVRKQHDMVLRALGVVFRDVDREKVVEEDMHSFVIHAVTEHIAKGSIQR